MDFDKWLARQDKKPVTPLEEKAYRLWYALLMANYHEESGYGGYIDTSDWEDPTDAPDYIAVIVKFLEGQK